MSAFFLKKCVLLPDGIPVRRMALSLTHTGDRIAPVRPAVPVTVLVHVHGEPCVRLRHGMMSTDDVRRRLCAVDA